MAKKQDKKVVMQHGVPLHVDKKFKPSEQKPRPADNDKKEDEPKPVQ